MTEKGCLAYCYDQGYDWGGPYRLFDRVSCWCCPLQGLDELRTLRREFPELWRQLLEWEAQTRQDFRKDFSVEELEVRFGFEEERFREGKRIRGEGVLPGTEEPAGEACVSRAFFRWLSAGCSESFLVGVPFTTSFSLDAVERHRNDEMVSYRHYCNVFGDELYADTKLTKWEGHHCYLHIYFDSTRAALDEKKFSHQILTEYGELCSGSMVKEHRKDYERFFTVRETPKRGRKSDEGRSRKAFR